MCLQTRSFRFERRDTSNLSQKGRPVVANIAEARKMAWGQGGHKATAKSEARDLGNPEPPAPVAIPRLTSDTVAAVVRRRDALPIKVNKNPSKKHFVSPTLRFVEDESRRREKGLDRAGKVMLETHVPRGHVPDLPHTGGGRPVKGKGQMLSTQRVLFHAVILISFLPIQWVVRTQLGQGARVHFPLPHLPCDPHVRQPCIDRRPRRPFPQSDLPLLVCRLSLTGQCSNRQDPSHIWTRPYVHGFVCW